MAGYPPPYVVFLPTLKLPFAFVSPIPSPPLTHFPSIRSIAFAGAGGEEEEEEEEELSGTISAAAGVVWGSGTEAEISKTEQKWKTERMIDR